MKKLISALMFLLVLCGCTGEVEQKTGSIYGVVSYSNSAEPVKGIGVELYVYDDLEERRLLLKTVTSDDGSYTFENLASGKYRLRVESEGYETDIYDVQVEVGRQARADMQLVEINTYVTVSTLEVANIKGSSATLNGLYDSEYSSYRPTEYGFVYSQSSNPKNDGKKIPSTNSEYSNGVYTFSSDISDLSKGIYYVQAYAKNSIGTTYGSVVSFEVSGFPAVKTLAVTNMTGTTATINGEVEYEGSPAYTEKGFVYSSSYPKPTVNDPISSTTKVTVSGNSKEFSANISGLTSGATYYVRAYITNESGTSYGDAVKFISYNIPEGIVYLVDEKLMVMKSDLGSGSWDAMNSLCEQSNFGGYSDWRMPTIGELGILYNKRTEIGGFRTYDYSNSYRDTYWSSTPDESSSYYYMYFDDGDVYSSGAKSIVRSVRAVRTVK